MVKTVSKLTFIFSMIVSPYAFSQGSEASQFDKLLYNSDKGSLPYRMLKPEHADKEKKYPLIIFLHGAGERGNDNEVQIAHIKEMFLDRENRKNFPCYVIAPQCPKNVMWASYDRNGQMTVKPSLVMQLVIGLMDKIEAEFPIEPSRIYITGLSMGGYGTWELLVRFPHRFAAAVPICGGGHPLMAPSIIHIPIWAFHGNLDTIVLPRNSRAMIKALQAAGGNPGYTEYPDVGHDSWTYAYRDPYLLPWIFSKRLGRSEK